MAARMAVFIFRSVSQSLIHVLEVMESALLFLQTVLKFIQGSSRTSGWKSERRLLISYLESNLKTNVRKQSPINNQRPLTNSFFMDATQRPVWVADDMRLHAKWYCAFIGSAA